MSVAIRQFVNSVNDKRIAKALNGMLDRMIPTTLDKALTAYAGGGQANALPLNPNAAFHEVTTVATAADSIALPPARVGQFHFLKNSAAANAMQVFAPDPDTIDSVATATGVSQLAGDAVLYVCLVDGNYIRLGGVQATEAFGDITADNLAMANPIVYDHNTTITAFATGGQASATALTGEFNNVTVCATAGDSVKLPAAALGKSITVKNSGAASLAVFPATGDAINALAANLSVNIPVGGETTFRAIDGTTYETNEVFVSSAPTTQRGEFVFKASDNAADHEVIFTNASHGQATTTTVPDPAGATGTVVLEEITNVFDLPQRYDSNTTITAFATGGQASATALTGEYNTVAVCATAADSVKLPAAAAGLEVTVRNLGAAICAVFPATGDAINALAANLSVDLPVLGELTFQAVDATTWYTQRAMSLPAPTTQRGNFVMKVADNAANHEVAFVNASHGQATVHTVPDPGSAAASFVLTEGAQTINGAKTFGSEADFAGNTTGSPGAGFTDGVGAIHKAGVMKVGGIIKTSILLDLTGTGSSTTALDIIGSGASAAHIGQITAAKNGTILTGRMTCLEAPTGGDPDINLYSATENTGVFDALVTSLTETALLDSGASWTNGRELSLTAIPAANEYLYLAVGSAGGAPGTYTAGKFLIELEGYDA